MKKTFDFIVLGAGSAGCACAGELARQHPDATVALVEAGGSPESPAIDVPGFASGPIGMWGPMRRFNWGFHSQPEKALNNRRLYLPRGRGFGGSSIINAMLYARGHPSDYEHWAAASGDQRWSFAKVLEVFKRFENNSRGASAHHGVGGPLHVRDNTHCKGHSYFDAYIAACRDAGIEENDDFCGPDTYGCGFYQSTVMHRAGLRCHAHKAFVEAGSGGEGYSNLVLLQNTFARRILLENGESGGAPRAAAVEVVGNPVFEYRDGQPNLSPSAFVSSNSAVLTAGKEIIVSLGAYQSPVLLQQSGIGEREQLSAAGINCAVNVPAVGKHLKDHPDFTVVYKCATVAPSLAVSFSNLSNIKRGLENLVENGTGFMSGRAEGGAFFDVDPTTGGVLPKSAGKKPQYQLHFVSAPLRDHSRNFFYGSGYCINACLLYPKSEGTVRCAAAGEHNPIIEKALLSHPADMERMAQAVPTVRAIMEGGAFEKLQPRLQGPSCNGEFPRSLEDTINCLRENVEVTYHPTSTCRMGQSGEADVVDARLRVQGVRGLRVADASIMPDIIGGNTNAPCMMIGIQCADAIVDEV